MNRLKLIASSSVAALALAGAFNANAQNLQLLSSWDRTYDPVTVFADGFIEEVAARTDGAVSMNLLGPETVHPFEQLAPVSAGVFDLLFTHGAYHLGESGLVFGMDTVIDDPDMRRESGIFDVIDAHYQEQHNQKLLGVFSAASGYHIMLREPLEPGERLDGKRIRASGTYHNLVTNLGGDTVTLPASDIYSALERGVVDGAAWPVFGALSYGWYEVAGYMTRPMFGTNNHTLLMNLDAWNSLDDATQATFLEVAQELEIEGRRQFEDIWDEEEAELMERGMQPTHFDDEVAEQLNRLFGEGVWQQVINAAGADGENLQEFVLEQGLLQD